ncbi:hypothetical protein Moror_3619 [Moniliophthora roreri MCA 2997]|uniref:GST N-terminal domain-containing protein n=2 Tax=Moniliophthora roreri TaxID=221103 RepID=V2Y0D2_MONRO|nr:hypothetical protein Moror_3619 [Moniliophthora roreri MCA 2997]KAI3603561.1 hypothetical protein WG66_006008 [Moniliophthora roreri]
MITLYDVGPNANLEHPSVSPHVRKARYTLHYKNIPYTVSWVNFFTLEETAKRVGAAPTGTRADGTPKYTVPFIVDSSTGAVVSDSYLIAVYLDKTYPDTPRLVPEGTGALQWAFAELIFSKIMPIVGIVRPLMESGNDPEFVKGIEKAYGPATKLSDEQKVAAWAAVKGALDDIAKWYPARDEEGNKATYLTGERPIYADFSFIPIFYVVKMLFEDSSEQWKDLASWNGGRWARMLEAVEGYVSTEVSA